MRKLSMGLTGQDGEESVGLQLNRWGLLLWNLVSDVVVRSDRRWSG